MSQLTFDAFRQANVTRCLRWHPAGIRSWSPSDWLTAVTGELGELASLLKMRNRERDGLPGNKFSPTHKQIADELADVLTYLDLLASVLDVDLGAAAVEKFNEVSERVGFPDRITLAPSETRPTTLSEFVHAPDAVREAVGSGVVDAAIKRQSALSAEQVTLQPAVLAEIERNQHPRGYAMNAETYRQNLSAMAEFAVQQDRLARSSAADTTALRQLLGTAELHLMGWRNSGGGYANTQDVIERLRKAEAELSSGTPSASGATKD